MNTNLGLYIHIPFCAKKCDYCDFYSLTGADDKLMNRYAAALISHIEETARFTGKSAKGRGLSVETVYFGGGTPTLFGASRLSKVLGALQKHYDFAASSEITLEANPGTVTFKELKKLRKAGFNRISFGVQAVQPELLKALGRIHTAEQAADAVRDAQKAGFDNISVDLLYGLPGQTAEMVTESLQSVFTWKVQHISFYGLKLEEGTPLHALQPELPSSDEQADVYLAAVELMREKGFEQYEISNFALRSYLCRHNMRYWTLDPYIGLGPAAHSDFGGRRYANIKDVKAYIEGVSTGGAVIEDGQTVTLPLVERAGEYIMLGLRTVRGISSNEYTRLFKASFDSLEKKLEQCAKWELAERQGDRWRLTPKGFLVSNRIIGELLDV